MEASGISTADGVLIDQWTDNGGGNQKWRIDSVGSGNYKFTNINSGKVLDVPGFRPPPEHSWTNGPIMEEPTNSLGLLMRAAVIVKLSTSTAIWRWM